MKTDDRKEQKIDILEQIDRASCESVVLSRSALSADAGHHVCTEVAGIDEIEDKEPFWRDEGMTLWAWPSPVSPAASPALLAWDWVASESGVVARRTATFCYSNIELLGPDRLPLDFSMHALIFSTVIGALPWQAQVQVEIARIRTRYA